MTKDGAIIHLKLSVESAYDLHYWMSADTAEMGDFTPLTREIRETLADSLALYEDES